MKYTIIENYSAAWNEEFINILKTAIEVEFGQEPQWRKVRTLMKVVGDWRVDDHDWPRVRAWFVYKQATSQYHHWCIDTEMVKAAIETNLKQGVEYRYGGWRATLSAIGEAMYDYYWNCELREQERISEMIAIVGLGRDTRQGESPTRPRKTCRSAKLNATDRIA